MFNDLQEQGNLWAVAVCIAAFALVVAQVGKAVSSYVRAAQKVTKTTEWNNWG